MREIFAQGISGGKAIGPLRVFHKEIVVRCTETFSNAENEWAQFLSARKKAAEQLEALAEKARMEAGEEAAQLFETHILMTKDPDLEDGVSMRINEKNMCARGAVLEAGEELARTLTEMDDEYMSQRGADVRDVAERIAAALSEGRDMFFLDTPSVIAADDISPSELMGLDRVNLRGMILFSGKANGHTAILARTMGIPTVIKLDKSAVDGMEGAAVLLDGDSGRIVFEPDENEISRYFKDAEKAEKEKAQLERFRSGEAVTKDGKRVFIYCNIGSPDDVDGVLSNGGEGIGLFRSEFLFLSRDSYPTEEEQFSAYRKVLEKMGGREVVIRTCDIGSDKKADYFCLPQEDNPALGLRAIRLCFARPELFKTQLRALYRASVFGNLSIMFPMIASLWEIREAKTLAKEVMDELHREGVPYDENVPLGIMIETPAAAVMSDELAKDADFFSIGTNDLTQYTLACDRNGDLGRHFDAHHPAVLRLIEMTAKSAHAAGIKVGICGELGADTSLMDFFISIGIDDLSVAAVRVPMLRKHICGM